MAQSSIESSLETLNLSGQQQPSLPYTPLADDIDEVWEEQQIPGK